MIPERSKLQYNKKAMMALDRSPEFLTTLANFSFVAFREELTRISYVLTLSQASPGFYVSAVKVF